MSKSDYTRLPLMELIFALPAATWQLRLVPDHDHESEPVLICMRLIALAQTIVWLHRRAALPHGARENRAWS